MQSQLLLNVNSMFKSLVWTYTEFRLVLIYFDSLILFYMFSILLHSKSLKTFVKVHAGLFPSRFSHPYPSRESRMKQEALSVFKQWCDKGQSIWKLC